MNKLNGLVTLSMGHNIPVPQQSGNGHGVRVKYKSNVKVLTLYGLRCSVYLYDTFTDNSGGLVFYRAPL